MNQVQNLQHIARELLYLGMDGSPIYTDHFRQLNTEVFRLSEALFSMKGATSEEEAAICLSLLMGYNATIYNDGDKESKIQSILDRSFAVLDHLPASLLKCQLLTYCYGEVFEEDLAQEAHQIMDRKPYYCQGFSQRLPLSVTSNVLPGLHCTGLCP